MLAVRRSSRLPQQPPAADLLAIRRGSRRSRRRSSRLPQHPAAATLLRPMWFPSQIDVWRIYVAAHGGSDLSAAEISRRAAAAALFRTPSAADMPPGSTRHISAEEARFLVEADNKRRFASNKEALDNPDILACIFRNLGPSTFADASTICKAWHAVCRTDSTVLRAVALFQGGLTKAKLIHLFALEPDQVFNLPQTRMKRLNGGFYFLFEEPAIDALLGPSGLAEWRLRLRARAESKKRTKPPARPRKRQHWQEEERLAILKLKASRLLACAA